MAGFSELAASMMVSAQQRLDATALNVSNISTPGFRSRKAFQRVVDARQVIPTIVTARSINSTNAALKATGNPLDIAITGGSLLVRSGEALVPAAAGQFHRDADGRLVDIAGRALQVAGGGDVIVSSDTPVMLRDGTLLVGGQAEARIGAFATSAFESEGAGQIDGLLDQADDAVIHQGMTIPSDVDLGNEMIEISRASRMAETGARVFQIYDELMGRAASKLGEIGR